MPAVRLPSRVPPQETRNQSSRSTLCRTSPASDPESHRGLGCRLPPPSRAAVRPSLGRDRFRLKSPSPSPIAAQIRRVPANSVVLSRRPAPSPSPAFPASRRTAPAPLLLCFSVEQRAPRSYPPRLASWAGQRQARPGRARSAPPLPAFLFTSGPSPWVRTCPTPPLFLLGQEVSARSFFPVAANLAIFHMIAVLQKSPC